MGCRKSGAVETLGRILVTKRAVEEVAFRGKALPFTVEKTDPSAVVRVARGIETAIGICVWGSGLVFSRTGVVHDVATPSWGVFGLDLPQ